MWVWCVKVKKRLDAGFGISGATGLTRAQGAIQVRFSLMCAPTDPWQEYRRRRNLVLYAFLGYVPCVSVIALLAQFLFHNLTLGFVAAIAWMTFFAVAAIRHTSFRCPRCGKWLFAKWWYHNPFARRCVH